MSIREHEDGVTIDILVVPRASRTRFGPKHGDRIKVSVTSPPVDGAANQAIVDLLAKTFKCPRRQIEVISGHSSRRKTLRITGVKSPRIESAIT